MKKAKWSMDFSQSLHAAANTDLKAHENLLREKDSRK